MKKLAIIRTDSGIHKCPFGLGVNKACKNAGNSVEKMTPLEKVSSEERKFQIEHNVAVYMLYGEGRCIYADQIITGNKVVNCDYGDVAAGMHSSSVRINQIPAAPAYLGYAGLSVYHSYPFNEYWENLSNTTGPERLYGFASSESTENLEENGQEKDIENILNGSNDGK